MKGTGILCMPLAMLLLFGCLVCAAPCVQAEPSSMDSTFTNVKAGFEVLKKFVISFANTFILGCKSSLLVGKQLGPLNRLFEIGIAYSLPYQPSV